VRRTRVGKRYAKALFELALEKKQIDILERDIDALNNTYQEVKEFRIIVTSPTISSKAKQDAFKAVFSGQLNPLTINFMLILFSKGRENILDDIIYYLREIFDQHRGIMRGEVQSVISLSDNQMQELKSTLDKTTGKDVILTQHKNTKLLGGLVVKIQDTVIDTSLRTQLEKLGEQLTESY
jgi:F-type H+-transporting ATPase subunit delta